MISEDSSSDLNLTFSLKIEGFAHMVFATSETMFVSAARRRDFWLSLALRL